MTPSSEDVEQTPPMDVPPNEVPPIAASPIDATPVDAPPIEAPRPLRPREGLDAWEQITRRAASVLHEEDLDLGWVARLKRQAQAVRELGARDPDAALYILLNAAGNEVSHYSTQHAMACLVIAELAGRWLDWPEGELATLSHAALSMNVSMTRAQDAMATQVSALSESQRGLVRHHAERSAELLKSAGVDDAQWLETVRRHHTRGPADPASGDDIVARLSELLRRVDIYTAKLSRRGARQAVTPAIAARDACLGTGGHPDSIGATLLRVLGLYPPGTYVVLANGDIAVVVRRGDKAHTPIVASVRRADGGLLVPPQRRDTALPLYAVRRGVEPGEARVRLDHARVLGCGVGPARARPVPETARVEA